jgi:hypothetical protein
VDIGKDRNTHRFNLDRFMKSTRFFRRQPTQPQNFERQHGNAAVILVQQEQPRTCSI